MDGLDSAPLHPGVPTVVGIDPPLEVERPQLGRGQGLVGERVEERLDAFEVRLVGPLLPVPQAPGTGIHRTRRRGSDQRWSRRGPAEAPRGRP